MATGWVRSWLQDYKATYWLLLRADDGVPGRDVSGGGKRTTGQLRRRIERHSSFGRRNRSRNPIQTGRPAWSAALSKLMSGVTHRDAYCDLHHAEADDETLAVRVFVVVIGRGHG